MLLTQKGELPAVGWSQTLVNTSLISPRTASMSYLRHVSSWWHKLCSHNTMSVEQSTSRSPSWAFWHRTDRIQQAVKLVLTV